MHSQKGNVMTITEKQNALFEELRKTVPEAVLDGVVEEGEYCSASIRLMFVLKEVNGKTVPDLCDFLRKGGRPQTWDNIARWIEGILHLEADRPWKYWEQNNQSRRERMLKQICAVNVKKTAGGHTSDRKQVQKAAADNGEILCRQLKLYNPDLIICCGTDGEFVKACYPAQSLEWKQTTRGIWYFIKDGKTVLSFVHPEARVKDSILHYALMDAVREMMQKSSLN